MKSQVEIKLSNDGSTTLYRPDMDEHYHSIYGAINEAQHVFIKMGLEMVHQNRFNILEIGFGTGLNVLLTALSLQKDVVCNYLSLEKYPLDVDTVQKLNYTNVVDIDNSAQIFHKIHNVEWEAFQKITPQLNLKKHKADLINFKSNLKFDLIYFDAFGPVKQPEMWTKQIFESLFIQMPRGAFLVTYSSKGDVRRAMIAAGFEVEKVAGPPGKREMLRAKKA